MRPARGTKGRDGSSSDDLDAQTCVDKHAEEAIPRGGGLLCADDALVDTHVRGVAVAVVRDG